MNHNCWYQPEGEMIYMKSARYTAAQFGDFQKATGQGAGSFVADPRLVDPAQGDFHLLPDSPCRNTGLDVGFTRDFEGTPIPQGPAPDIGAYESK